ncbi:hypothetical protein [Sphingomonas sp. OV641]|uniref:hypothetical protein n=1 Tax=Sphingomonas sp. OV641 TaxID=1881068 RepID=UPI000B84AE9F|nr:hypothetical protein [Sphingomonas sp. OV641]
MNLRWGVADQVLGHQYTAEAANHFTGGDSQTSPPLDRRKIAVRAAIIGLFSWRVINWSVSDKMAAQLGADAL